MPVKDGSNKVNLKQITVIEPGKTTRSYVDQDPDLKELQKLVGGYIQKIPEFNRYKGKPCIAYFNEEGRNLALRYNETATELWWKIAPRWYGDHILGPVVIVQSPAKTSQK